MEISNNLSKKKIGLLIHSLCNGGAERAVSNLSRTLSEKYDVHLLVFDSSVIDYPYGGTLHTTKDFNLPIPILGKAIRFLYRWHWLWKCKKENNLNTVISFMPAADLYNVLTKGKGKVICSVRNIMSLVGLPYFWRKCIAWCVKKADITVSVSEIARQDLLKNFINAPDKVTTILNLCDLESLQITNPEVENLTKNFDFSGGTIVTVGRLEFQKAQWHLLKAFSLVHKKYPKAKLVLFGQGPLEKSLKRYAAKLGISDSTFFMGYIRNQHTFLRKCDMFVLPSFSEGLSNALLEAMACGLPVISTDCQSEVLSSKVHEVKIPESAEYGLLVPGFLLEPFNEDDMKIIQEDIFLAQAMEKLLADKELNTHYRNKSLQRIKDFSPQTITARWIEVIEGKRHA